MNTYYDNLFRLAKVGQSRSKIKVNGNSGMKGVRDIWCVLEHSEGN